MKEITRNDFNLFQNEILGLIKKSDTKSTEKIMGFIGDIQKSELISEQKFENFKYEVEQVIKNLETNDSIMKLHNRINDLNKKIEELKTVNNTKISNFERDLSNACYKYDRIFLNNISSPGLIGDGCPYPTMRAFLEYTDNKIKDFMSSKDKFGIDFKKYHEWVQASLDKFREELDKYKEENEKKLEKEIKQYDKRSMEKMNIVEDKLSFIRVENGRYNFNLNKKSEELEEKLQNFYYMNDNLIKIYNKVRQEFIKSQKDQANIIQYLNHTKSSSHNANKTTYDKFNKKIDINEPQLPNIENILPSFNSIEDLNKVVNSNIPKNINSSKQNKRFTKLFMKKNTVDFDKNILSFNKSNRLSQNINNNIYTEITGNENEKENPQKFIRGGLSEKKLSQRKSTFRKKNLIIEEENQLTLLKIKEENKPEKTKKLHNIQEDETENKEKNDKQTSPHHSTENIKNKVFVSSSLAPNKINSFTFERKEIRNKNNAKEKEREEKKINAIKKQYEEEFNEIKIKFEDFYEKSNDKINYLTQHLNNLIRNMNKVIFNQKGNLKLTKNSVYIPGRKHIKLFFDNSEKKITLPLNKSSDEKLNKTTKEKDILKDNSGENIKSLKHEIKLNKKFFIKEKYLNENFKFNILKPSELKGSSSDISNFLNGKNKISEDSYYGRYKLESINKIENFLIKKFTDPV